MINKSALNENWVLGSIFEVNCKKIIDYDQNRYITKGLSAAIPNLSINVEVIRQRKNVREANEVARA
jgi:hypothetical protein